MSRWEVGETNLYRADQVAVLVRAVLLGMACQFSEINRSQVLDSLADALDLDPVRYLIHFENLPPRLLSMRGRGRCPALRKTL